MINILVAGAGKGIGKATADLAYESGYNVIGVSRTKDDLKDRPYKILVSDLVYPESISLLKPYAQDIDTVINCTGTSIIEDLNENWSNNIMYLIEQNLRPVLHLYQAFLPKFREKQRGHFVHVSSGALDFYAKGEGGYCASKAALEALVLTYHDEDIKIGVKHHALRAALADTPLTRRICQDIKDWSKHYTAREIASYLIDIITNPDNYPKPIIPLSYKPIRIASFK